MSMSISIPSPGFATYKEVSESMSQLVVLILEKNV
jgi:hypothetical protein